MLKNVIVLTLSIKFNGYCIAVYDESSNKMLRLVKDQTVKNGIPKEYAYGIKPLDEVEIKIADWLPKQHQTENVQIDLEYGLNKTGKKADISTIYNNLQKYSGIFDNTNYKLEDATCLDHSLEIIRFTNMHIQTKVVTGKNKTKANFLCDSKIHLNYSVTDANYFNTDEFIVSGYAVVSLPATDDFTKQYGYFKYISAIFPD